MDFQNFSNRFLVAYIINADNKSDRNEAWAQLLKQNPGNDDLRYIIEYTDLKQEAWAQLLKQNPGNDDLRYIIEYTDLKQEAGAQLLKQNPGNDDLRYIIRYTDLKQEAWAQLLKQNPGNDDLRYIIEYTDLKQEAAIELRKNFGITEAIDEDALMKEIAESVLARPGSLRMDKWHCGTSHCIGGWACTLNGHAKKIESLAGTETAAFAILPKYSHLFYKNDKEALAILEEVAKK